MAMNHMNWKRVRHRILEELDATRKIAKLTSWSNALTTFIAKVDIQIMNNNGYKEYPLFKRHLLKKHDVMLNYLEQCYADFFKTYDITKVDVPEEKGIENTIWICWWQGEEQAPEIVKRCIASIRRNAPSHKVVIITEENYKEYVTFPEWVEKKRRNGIFSRTHYSDLLRLSLLAKYGGMWIDSTFLCTNNEIEHYFSLPLWSIKRPDYFHASVASGYFAGYSWYCNAENRKIFALIRDIAFYYWRKYNFLVDYLLVDYWVVLAQRHNEIVRKAFENIPSNNPQCDELYKMLGEPYDESRWNNLKKDTCLFKLTWKQIYPIEKEGKKTFYGMLLDGQLK